jgi:hypothetical protein
MTKSYDSIYGKMSPSGDGAPTPSPESAADFDPNKHISPGIAHELNNILAIVQGYADRLILKYAGDAPLATELKSITEAARRAAVIVRDNTPQILKQPTRPLQQEEHEPSMA